MHFVTRWRALYEEHCFKACGMDGGDCGAILGFVSSLEALDGAGGILTSMGSLIGMGSEVAWRSGFPATSSRCPFMFDLSVFAAKPAKYATIESRDFVPKS